jgi:hypothetical protein
MNPAKSFACQSAYAIFNPDKASWDYHYVYWIGPIVGAVIAAVVYRWGVVLLGIIFHTFCRLLLASDRKRILFSNAGAGELQDDDEKQQQNGG